MSVDRIQRLNELIRRELAGALYHVGQGEAVEVAKISFVEVATSRDLRNATVFVSLLAPAAEQDDLMRWLWRHRIGFQSALATRIQLKYTPRLRFRQTTAIEQGDRVLGILAHLEDTPSDGPSDRPSESTGEA